MKIKFRPQPLPVAARHLALLPNFCRGERLLTAMVLVQLLVILLVLAAAGLSADAWRQLIAVSLLAQGITLLCTVGLCLLRPWLVHFNFVATACCSIALVLVVAALCAAASQVLLLWWQPQAGLPPFNIALFGQQMAVATVAAVIVLGHLFLRQRLYHQQQAELESRIQALQSRIRPHFLFNSMNMLASLIGSDPERAERVVEDLSDLFRHALAESNTVVPLREELALCRRYLALEKLRLGDRLQTLWEIGDYGSGVRIPCLTIQPVLENAVYHGIQMIPEGGELKVSIGRRGDRLEIAVSNPRNPRIQHNKGNRMAMSNIRTRLEAHFGAGSKVEAEVTGERYVTRISYPLPAEAGGQS